MHDMSARFYADFYFRGGLWSITPAEIKGLLYKKAPTYIMCLANMKIMKPQHTTLNNGAGPARKHGVELSRLFFVM